MDYYVLFELESYTDEPIPEIILITRDPYDIEKYLYDLGYKEDDIGQYSGVVSFVNNNSAELGLWVVHHYNQRWL